jgi:hypothetical protein
MVAIKGKGKTAVGLSVLNDADVLAVLQKLDMEVRFTVSDNAMRAAAKPIRSKMRSIVPDSRRTNSRALQSNRTRQKWANSNPLYTTLATVVRKHKAGATAFVGPSYSDGGGHGNLFSKDHPKAVYWGRDAVQASKKSRTVNRFVKRSADEAGAAAKAAAIKIITNALRNPTGSGLLK